MFWIAFFLGLMLSLAGAAGLAASFDLLPTELGLLYAMGGAVALSGGFITLAVAALIRRVDALANLAATPPEPVYVESRGPLGEAPPAAEPYGEPAPIVEAADAPINVNRVGHLPSLAAIEHALHEPEAAAALVGRYSAGGANYMIFSDGSIEAETEQGAFKFASMSEFKAHLAGKSG